MSRQHPFVHGAAVVAAFSAIFTWTYWRAVVDPVLLSQSDLYEYFLPIFLSPRIDWSAFEFSGIPVFADPGESNVYPIHALFAKVLHSWGGFAVAAHVIGASGMYLYVYSLTRSKTASFLSGLAFGLSEAMLERLAHMSMLHAVAWTPLAFYAIDRLLESGGRRWIGIGALLVAMLILAGHPQPAIYACLAAGAYAIVGGIAERKAWRYYADVAATFALGGLLSAVKLLPFAQSLGYMAREEVSYGHFTSQANTPAMMWSALFPTVLHEGREAPTYVGLLTIVFAIVGAVRGRPRWRTFFWIGAVAYCVIIGMGEFTPFTRFLYDYVPTYNRFRVGARHLFVAAVGAVTLAGLGIDAVQRGAKRPLLLSLLAVAGVMAIGLVYFHGPHTGMEFENRYPIRWSDHGFPAYVPNHIWTQVLVALATFGLCVAFALGRRKEPWVALMVLVLGVDLLNAQPFIVSRRGLDSVFIPESAAQPSVHVEQVIHDLAPTHQRFLAIGGTTTDVLIPATWARLWRVPIAGGYGPMLLDRYSRLSTMGRNGSVRPFTLALADQSLNLLSIRQIGVQPRDLESQGTFDLDGVTWEKGPFDLPVGRKDCGFAYDKTLSLPLPQDVEISAVELIVYMRCGEALAQGADVGEMTLVSSDGPVAERKLHVGIDVVEAALTDPSVARRARHKAIAGVTDPDQPDQLRTRITLRPPKPMMLSRLDVHALPSPAWVTIAHLTVVDANGKMSPGNLPAMMLTDERRWMKLRSFKTSHATDRGRDYDQSEEQPYTIYENLKALPRAWIASDLHEMSIGDALSTITWGQLPDGRAFDPLSMALMEKESRPADSSVGAGGAVQLSREDNGVFELETTGGGGVLVLSESTYPGWTATVDGASTAVYPVDASLMGVVVPAGQHHVVFRFAPPILWMSAIISVVALALVAALVLVPITVV